MREHANARSSWRVAFVACNKNAARFGEDPSFIYRCENLAAGLRAQGVEPWLGHVSKFPWHRRFDCVVFHRPRSTWRVRALHAWLRARGVKTIADFDDLVFEPASAEFSPGVVNGLVGLQQTTAQFASHAQALAAFSVVTVSTRILADEVGARFPKAHVAVVPNAVHWSWHRLPVVKPPTHSARKVISYLPGTRSHDRDFAEMAGAIGRVLARHPEVILSVTGPLNFSIEARSGQIEHHDKLPFSRYHERFYGVLVNLAPLESSPFTRCKSAIKVIEGAFWNIPTVCSSLPDAERLATCGALFAEGERDIEMLLERLIMEPDYYRSVASGLRERVLVHANVYEVAAKWLEDISGTSCHIFS